MALFVSGESVFALKTWLGSGGPSGLRVRNDVGGDATCPIRDIQVSRKARKTVSQES
jgi:hypothetical protein